MGRTSNIDCIYTAIQYIESRLQQSLCVKDIARTANLSHWHFQRLFRQHTSDSIGNYIRQRRLSNAASELLTSDQRVIDIAFKYQFESHENFSRWFRQYHGLTPSQYRYRNAVMPYEKKHALSKTAIQHRNSDIDRKVEIISISAKSMAGIKGQFISALSNQYDHQEKIPKIWSKYFQVIQSYPAIR